MGHQNVLKKVTRKHRTESCAYLNNDLLIFHPTKTELDETQKLEISENFKLLFPTNLELISAYEITERHYNLIMESKKTNSACQD
jgi:hypothetical protein